MIILGVILLVVGYIVPIPLLVTLGWVLVAIGLILTVLGALGHGVGGRRTWL